MEPNKKRLFFGLLIIVLVGLFSTIIVLSLPCF